MQWCSWNHLLVKLVLFTKKTNAMPVWSRLYIKLWHLQSWLWAMFVLSWKIFYERMNGLTNPIVHEQFVHSFVYRIRALDVCVDGSQGLFRFALNERAKMLQIRFDTALNSPGDSIPEPWAALNNYNPWKPSKHTPWARILRMNELLVNIDIVYLLYEIKFACSTFCAIMQINGFTHAREKRHVLLSI